MLIALKKSTKHISVGVGGAVLPYVKVLTFNERNKRFKNNKIQRKLELKFTFPAKAQKCIYDLIVLNRRLHTS